MIGNHLPMKDNSFIVGLADSLFHWVNYIVDVKRREILNEGSIKYAISEYLEVSKQKLSQRTTIASVQVKEYVFEFTHPIYKGKSMDLNVTFHGKYNETPIFVEFKFLHNDKFYDSTMDTCIDDIFRLYSVSSSKKGRSFFLLLAERDQIRSVGITSAQRGDTLQRKDGVGQPGHKVNFSKLLSIDTKEPACETLIQDLLPSEKGDHIARFKNTYNLREGCEDAILPQNKINTKLVYPTPDMLDSCNMGVYVWEIM